MKLLDYAKDRIKGLSNAVVRFWAVFLLLIATAVLISITIETDEDLGRHILALTVGVFSFLCAQVLCERFDAKLINKILFMSAAALGTVAYYVYILNVEDFNDVVGIKTVTLIFALFIAFIWIPSVKGENDFNAVFLSVFKSFFTSVFFSGIIFGGISLIIVAVDALLFDVDEKIFAHTANIVWVIWAPMLMLSLIPVFAGKEKNTAKIEKSTGYPKFLEILLTYVLIPLASVYTLVLLIYIGKTVFLAEWTDNLLEPLIISYLIAVILIYILVKRINNAFTGYFRTIFPILLAAIALFQLVSSIIKASNEGIVASRYYVLLFSIYSIICGILLFIYPKKKNGYVGSLAILLALICITPFVGAFDISAVSQSSVIKSTLEENGMISGDSIIPSQNLSEDDKEKIYEGIMYLDNIDALDKLNILPEGFNPDADFYTVFGFNPYEGYYSDKISRYYSLDSTIPVSISGYDYLNTTYIYYPNSNLNETLSTITQDGKEYSLKIYSEKDQVFISIYNEKTEIIVVSINDIFDIISEYGHQDGIVDQDKLTFDFENDSVKIRVILRTADIYGSYTDVNYSAEAIILFSIK